MNYLTEWMNMDKELKSRFANMTINNSLVLLTRSTIHFRAMTEHLASVIQEIVPFHISFLKKFHFSGREKIAFLCNLVFKKKS